MVKYKVGDEIVIRKDLKTGEWYGVFEWLRGMERLKVNDYVVIEKVDNGYYFVKGVWYINDEMIEGLYDDGKRYYIKLIGNRTDVLHISDCNNHTFEMDDDLENLKCKFTEKEANEIIGSSKILYKELV